MHFNPTKLWILTRQSPISSFKRCIRFKVDIWLCIGYQCVHRWSQSTKLKYIGICHKITNHPISVRLISNYFAVNKNLVHPSKKLFKSQSKSWSPKTALHWLSCASAWHLIHGFLEKDKIHPKTVQITLYNT